MSAGAILTARRSSLLTHSFTVFFTARGSANRCEVIAVTLSILRCSHRLDGKTIILLTCYTEGLVNFAREFIKADTNKAVVYNGFLLENIVI